MIPLSCSVERYLKKNGFAFESRKLDDQGHSCEFLLKYRAAWGRVTAAVIAREKLRSLTIFHYPQFHVPLARMSDVAIFLHAANFDLSVGCFELSTTIGVARFKAAAHVGRSRLNEGTIRLLFTASLSAVDRYFPVLQRILADDLSVADAIAASCHDRAGGLVWGHQLPYEKQLDAADAHPNGATVFRLSPSDSVH